MTYLVDTDLLVDALGGRRHVMHVLNERADDGLAVSIISVGELYEGAFSVSDPKRLLPEFRQFLREYEILGLSDSTMEVFARERAALRRRGMLIPDMDLLIASTAITHGLTLMTRNARHFKRIPNLALDDQ